MDKDLAITPIDGRNREKVAELADYFSEYAYTKIRCFIEIEYIKNLARIFSINLSADQTNFLNNIHKHFSLENFKRIKEIEKSTNHDIKAIEYYLKEVLNNNNLEELSKLVHWGLTSEDVNNLAYSIMLRDFKNNILTKEIYFVMEYLSNLILKSDHIILGRTHGQIASPTLLSKELSVFLSRLISEFRKLKEFKFTGKISGSVGSYTELYYSIEDVNWIKENSNFIAGLDLTPVEVTTQILPAENICEFFDILNRIQNILINLNQDLWMYLSIGYFRLENKLNEVGSSIMPQKINPIQFEASEGGFQLSNALYVFYKDKLSKSRLQRDLSDSTVKRSFGFTFGYTLLALKGLRDGMNRLQIDSEFINNELKSHKESLLSMIQTKQRLLDADAYEKFKLKYRGNLENSKDIPDINLLEVLTPVKNLVKEVLKEFSSLNK